MALNTNGWDYTYNVNIEKLNALISNEKNSFSTLIVNTIEIADSTSPATILLTISSLNMTDFKVLNTSLYPILDVSMKLSGKLGIYSFADIELKISININWLNKGKINNSITSSDIVVNSTLLTTNLFGGDNLNDFINIFQNYLNGSIAISLSGSGNYSSISNPTIITPTNRDYYGNIYTFFANLNKFSLEVGSEWMKPTTLRFSVKSDVHKDLSDTSCFFSFCCMIGTNTNNDTAFVNINAIPDGSSSALVIERSAFAEYIVLPKLLGALTIQRNFDWKDNITLFSKDILISSNSAKINFDLAALKLEESEKLIIEKNKETATFSKVERDNAIAELDAARYRTSMEAIPLLEKAVTIHPLYTIAWLKLGNAYHYLGQLASNDKESNKIYLEKAQAAYQLVKDLQGKNTAPIASKYLGICLMDYGKLIGQQFGNLPLATSYLEQAKSINPKEAEIYLLLGTVYALQNNFDEAIKNAKISIELQPNNEEYKRNLETILALRTK